MSSSAHPSATVAFGPPREENKFRIYVQIAMILAVITGVEIVMVFLPFAAWFLIGTLVTLSIVKFLMVIFVFMHLRWDRLFCTVLFFIGLGLAVGTVAALLAIFRASDSVPLTSRTALAAPAAALLRTG
jgi:cytochrome c oxidase subunit IV